MSLVRPSASRALSPVIGVVCLVALTTVLAATVGAFAFDHHALGVTGPSVAISADPVHAYEPSNGDREQPLRLVHEGGPAVAVDTLELVVTVERTGQRAHLSGFPVRSNKLRATNVEGSSMLDLSHGETVGTLSSAPPDSDGTWSAGDRLGVRVTSCEVRLVPGDRVTVLVTHRPSGQVVAERRVPVA